MTAPMVRITGTDAPVMGTSLPSKGKAGETAILTLTPKAEEAETTAVSAETGDSRPAAEKKEAKAGKKPEEKKKKRKLNAAKAPPARSFAQLPPMAIAKSRFRLLMMAQPM